MKAQPAVPDPEPEQEALLRTECGYSAPQRSQQKGTTATSYQRLTQLHRSLFTRAV